MNIVRKVMIKPWLADGPEDHQGFNMPAVKVGLLVLIFVVGVLFFLITSAYLMRQSMANDWRRLPEPALLWLNTGVLVLASFTLHRALRAAEAEQMQAFRNALILSGVLTFGFLVGQILVWRELNAMGFYLGANPANSFFFMITAVHGLHLIGGLVAWGRTTARMYRGMPLEDLRLSVDLCATYWHVLLLVWFGMFALLLST